MNKGATAMGNLHTISGLRISLLLHIVLLALLLCLGKLTPILETAMVIDFTVTSEPTSILPSETTRNAASEQPVKSPPPEKIPDQSPQAAQISKNPVPSQEAAVPEKIEVAKMLQPPEAKVLIAPSREEIKSGPAELRKAVPDQFSPVTANNEIPAARGPRMTKQTAPTGTGLDTAPALIVREDPQTGYLKAHFEYIKNEIQRKIIYPLAARKNGWQGRVVVSFMVCEDGRVEQISIKESSGCSLLDKSAVKTIQQAAPFPAPPCRAELVVPINFNLV